MDQQIVTLKNALWLAIMQNKNETIVQFFNSPKIQLNVNTPLTVLGLNALHQASSNGNLNLVQFLVAIMKSNIDAQDNQGRTPLHYACGIGNQAIVDYLIQSKAQVNIQTFVLIRDLNFFQKGGETPIMIAARFHHSQLLQYLLETHSDKINWNLTNRLGQNVLQIFRSTGVNSLDKINQISDPIFDIRIQLLQEIK